MNEPAELVAYEQQITVEAHNWLADAERLEIRDADDAQAAADFLRDDIAPRRKAVEQFFAPLVAAAHAAHKALTTRRAAILERFAEPERIVRQKLAAWQQAEDERRMEAEAAVRDARAQSGGALVLPPHEPEKLDGVSFVNRVRAEVVDMAALCRAAAEKPHLLPLVQPNQKALDQMARALGEALSVPGVRTVVEKTTRVA